MGSGKYGPWDDNSAQMHTLEAIITATLMITMIVFAVQATSLTPLTSSTANAHIEAQLQMIGQDILSAADYSPAGQNSQLKNDVLNWSGEEYAWDGSTYTSMFDQNDTLENSSIGELMEFVAIPRGIAHNVNFRCINDEGNIITESYINNGEPSNNAVAISRKVLLSNSDIADVPSFSAMTGIRDVDDSNFYNIVEVKLILWRM